MNVVVTTRHTDDAIVDAAVKAHAEQQAQKLTRYYDLIQEIEVTIEGGREGHGGHHVEIIVDAEHKNEFVANCHDDRVYAAIDGCTAKLLRQLTEHKKKHRNRKHSGTPHPNSVTPASPPASPPDAAAPSA